MRPFAPEPHMVADEVHSSGLAAAIERHRDELRRFLVARCGNAGEAEDRLQELWIKALRQPAGPIGDPRAYLFRMANNLVLDASRARRRAMMRDRKWLADDAGGAGPLEDRTDP